jgi:hypothetical protein
MNQLAIPGWGSGRGIAPRDDLFAREMRRFTQSLILTKRATCKITEEILHETNAGQNFLYRVESGYLCKPDILTEVATTIKAPPDMILQSIGPLALTDYHPLDDGKWASLLEPVLDQVFNFIQKTPPQCSYSSSFSLDGSISSQTSKRMVFSCGPSCFKSSKKPV